MRYLTAGESHGIGLVGLIDNVPSNLQIDIDKINELLKLRQGGFGRGGRQKIESDKVEFISGLRNGRTLGSPISFIIKNKDYDNWEKYMDAKEADEKSRTLTRVRPGHADLSGAIKFDTLDARNVLERASARETATRVVAGGVALQFLENFGVKVSGRVKSVYNICDDKDYSFEEVCKAKNSEFYTVDNSLSERIRSAIIEAKDKGDTLGFCTEVRISGVKSGFGSPMQYDSKLDARLAFASMSVQSVKGVEIGGGFSLTQKLGSEVHDEIFYENDKFLRHTNRSGGVDGGMSTGEDIIITSAFKPIPTLLQGLKTVDLITKESCRASFERSDVCVANAGLIVMESVLAFEMAKVIAERLGGDNMAEMKDRWNKY